MLMTYTIVIVNLFLIAAVVFFGVWWRHSRIAAEQKQLQQNLMLDRDHELLPVSNERFLPAKSD